jgi:predicted ATPase/class 3 adenylate cyclase/DNA-binding NarL/FixJ family response regulator
MLATMSQIDSQADAPPLNWSDLSMTELLPTGTVTLLLADVEGSTRLWDSHPQDMAAAIALLDRTLADVLATYGGVRPVEQGEGDSFVVAFTRASDAVACALALQRAPLAPIRLRMGVHTGEVQLRDEGNYVGTTINRTARLRDLAHGGQILLSGATEEMVVDRLPPQAWLTDLGTHELRDLPRPERVVQLCHPDLRAEFPPLRTPSTVLSHNLPPQLTSFVGRRAQIGDVQRLIAENRLVTLTGAGGAGKTRLAVEVADRTADQFSGGVWYVDLAPITDRGLVPLAVARALGLADQPGRSTTDTVLRFVSDRDVLVVLDNCEHLLDACAALIVALLGACPGLRFLATSREPIAVAGEVTWRVPSLSLNDEAVELFAERAGRARPDFTFSEDSAAVQEICRCLDGMPLAIELAAARARALSVGEILDGLHDRFRLLTGGARTAVRRQQTLQASVDWSHALLTQSERDVFRRLAVFLGGFDLDAAQAVGAGGDIERYQVFELLGQLVDKSLVVAEHSRDRTRYRLLETMRQYGLERLGESGEADTVRRRHRDHYAHMAAQLDNPGSTGYRTRIRQAEIEIDNLRTAFAWSRENADTETALALASSLQLLWLARGRIQEGLAWFDAVITDENARNPDISPAVRARSLADKALLETWVGATDSLQKAEQALSIARDIDDPALLARALTACGFIAGYNLELARPYFAEAIGLLREIGDDWRLSRILAWEALSGFLTGDPIAVRAAAEEGLDLADAIGDRFDSRHCRWCLGWAQMWQGDLDGAAAQFRDVVGEAVHDVLHRTNGLAGLGYVLAHQGDTTAARAAAGAAVESAEEIGGWYGGLGDMALALSALGAGDVEAAAAAHGGTLQRVGETRATASMHRAVNAQVALARGDLAAARRWADDACLEASGWHQVVALTTHAQVAAAEGQPEEAERDARHALARCADIGADLGVPDILECLAALAGDAGSHHEAARLFGAAEAIRQRMGAVRFKIYDAGYQASVAALRNALGQAELDSAWTEGTALSVKEAIAYAQRGRGDRKRQTSGWESLTPTERDIVQLVSEGLANQDIATRRFVSPRTVQSHLTHVYTKLGLASRVQLAQEAGRHA